MAGPGLPEDITDGVTTGHVTDHEKIHDLLNEFDVAAQAASKGDLLVFDGTTLKRLAVGADDQVITADAAEALGIKWAAGGGGGGGGGSAPGWMGRLTTRPDSGHALDDEFADDTFSGWTEILPSGTVTKTEKLDVLSLLPQGQAASDCVAWVKAIPGGEAGAAFMVETAVIRLGISNYIMLGPLFSTGALTTSNVIWQMTYSGHANHPISDIRSGTFANVGTDHSSPGLQVSLIAGWLFQRFEFDPTNGFRQWFSVDGISWTNASGGWVANPLGADPTHVGFGISTWGGAESAQAAIEYVRMQPTA